jgi:electron transport complex protein RnfB
MCGYCDWCFAYFDPVSGEPGTGAEDLLCPLNAISREHIEDIYYEYAIDEDVCIGCAKCVRGCQASGNGSLYLQVIRTLCRDCNECRIAAACPSEAFRRIPVSESYLLKTRGGKH